jgi:hypothetical protein
MAHFLSICFAPRGREAGVNQGGRLLSGIPEDSMLRISID